MTRRATPPEVADRLHSAAIHLLRRLRRTDDASGLTPARLSVLSVLVFAGPQTLGNLARAERVRPPTISNLVGGIEREQLVQRTVDPEDRRIVRVAATSRGKRILERARRLRLDHLTDRMRRLSKAELATLDRAAGIMERVSVE